MHPHMSREFHIGRGEEDDKYARPQVENDGARTYADIAYEDEKALGTARVIIKNKDIAKIGRVAVLKEARKKGFGKNLMLEAMSYIKGQTTAKEIQLDAQLTAVKFYESLGFTSYGEVFKDAGIDHVAMTYPISRK